MAKNLIKGEKNGLVLYLDESSPWEDVLKDLEERLSSNSSFFKGARIQIAAGKRILSEGEKKSLEAVLAKLDIEPVFAQEKPREGREVCPHGGAFLLKRTLRSGQLFYFPGDLMVFGNVNPGAYVIADGDIIVFGTLRGVAHAGALGDDRAVIAAIRFEPSQVRIGKVIARGAKPEREEPEVAFVKGNKIVVVSLKDAPPELFARRERIWERQ